MRIPGRRRWALWHMELGLRQSDPHLAAMLAIFVRLTAGEAIASPEQRMTARRWIGRALAGLGCVLIAVAAGVSARARRVICRIGLACAAARWWFRGSVRRAVGLPSDRRLHGFLDAGPDQPYVDRPGAAPRGLPAVPDPVQVMVEFPVAVNQVVQPAALRPAQQGAQEYANGEHAAGRHGRGGQQDQGRSEQPDQPPSGIGILRRSAVAAACRVDGGQRGRAGHGHDAGDQGDQPCAL